MTYDFITYFAIFPFPFFMKIVVYYILDVFGIYRSEKRTLRKEPFPMKYDIIIIGAGALRSIPGDIP